MHLGAYFSEFKSYLYYFLLCDVALSEALWESQGLMYSRGLRLGLDTRSVTSAIVTVFDQGSNSSVQALYYGKISQRVRGDAGDQPCHC